MSGSGSARVYRQLIRLYPRAFRDEYGDDLVALFEQQCHDERPARVYARTALDLVVTVPIRHLEVPMPRRAPITMIVLYVILAVAGVVTAGLSGTNYVRGTIGLLVAVLATALAIITWRRNLFTASVDGSGAWWKLLAIGGGLIGSVLVGAQAGLEQWYLAMTMILAGIASALAGVVLGATRLFRRRTPLAG
jgi:hypothetical protein